MLPVLEVTQFTPTVAEHTTRLEHDYLGNRQGKFGTLFYHSITVDVKQMLLTRRLSRENINFCPF